jgi:hypothetical protein
LSNLYHVGLITMPDLSTNPSVLDLNSKTISKYQNSLHNYKKNIQKIVWKDKNTEIPPQQGLQFFQLKGKMII